MFKINKEEKVLKNIRFPKSLVRKIDKRAKENKVSFTKFVVLACLYALDNMENEK